ncbi:MAG TPA: helix-turn-helix transcriptional regulator [Gemmatimonadaceae bacterium]
MSSVHTPEYQYLLRQLRHARKEADLTQQAVADILDQQQSFVSKCESGERRVDAIELSRFALVYDKPLSYFLPPDIRLPRKTRRR